MNRIKHMHVFLLLICALGLITAPASAQYCDEQKYPGERVWVDGNTLLVRVKAAAPAGTAEAGRRLAAREQALRLARDMVNKTFIGRISEQNQTCYDPARAARYIQQNFGNVITAGALACVIFDADGACTLTYVVTSPRLRDRLDSADYCED